VAGGVLRPGTFPYIPDKSASYYINLAGGFDPAKNRNGAYTLMDKAGNELAKDAVVPPEAVVTAKLNTFQAVNGANLATTVTIVGLVATILTIVANVVTFPN
jgi:protein involved in polysaccharide export with SLBB domain